jgi:hypothetical protein
VNALVRRTIAAAAAGAAAVAARKAVELGWRLARDEPPPTAEGVRGDAELRDLLLWAALVAGAVVLARKVVTDGAERFLGDDLA